MSVKIATTVKSENVITPPIEQPISGILKPKKQTLRTSDVPSLELSDDSSVTSSSSSVDLLSSSFSLCPPRSPNQNDYYTLDDEEENMPPKKTVTFSPILVIHSHKITIGDSPSCLILPLALDWERAEPSILDLNRYELSPATRRRRQRGPRKLMFFERNELLQDVSGYTPAELYKAKKEGLEAQKREQEQFQQVVKACD